MEAFPTATPWKTRPLGIRFLPCPVRKTHVCLTLVSMMPLWDGVHAWSRCIWLLLAAVDGVPVLTSRHALCHRRLGLGC